MAQPRMNRSGTRIWWLLTLGIVFTINASFALHLFLAGSVDNSGRSRQLTQEIPSFADFPEDATSACLCVMDDNHYLTEWIAYHYHTAKLRHLIITTDPDSVTKPTRVLDRWRDRMVIEEWDDSNFLDDEDIKFPTIVGGKDPVLKNHRKRQATFNLECLKSLKRQNRGWVLMIDTDEYLTYNPDLTDPEHFAYDRDLELPAIEEPGSLSTLLDQLVIPHPEFDHVSTPCIPAFRRQFAALESPDEVLHEMIPAGFDPKNFQTLRWRRYGYETLNYEARFNKTCHSRRAIPNKVLIDLGRLRYQDLGHSDNTGNPHRPLDSICPSNVYLNRDESPFMVHHYLGTIEQWLYRAGDKRGQGYRIARYDDLNGRIGRRQTDQVRAWLNGFVELLGTKEASRLLDGVGILEPLPNQPTVSNNEKPDITPAYKVGDIVQANYKGDGYWFWAEVGKVHSNGYYNIFFAEDCSEEIASPENRLRRTGKADDDTKLTWEKLAREQS